MKATDIITSAYANEAYEVHNDAYKYDEHYSEAPSEFFLEPELVGVGCINYAKKSILSAILNKSRKIIGSYSDYNDCSYPQVYDQN